MGTGELNTGGNTAMDLGGLENTHSLLMPDGPLGSYADLKNTYQLNMAFGLVYIGIADETKFTNNANNFSEIFSRFLKTVVCKMFSSFADKIVSKFISKCWVLKNTFKKVRNHSYENDFDLHEKETACRTHFHMNGFALRLVLILRQKATREGLFHCRDIQW